ncbi:uncharacterized protein V6R79_001145 [Siganus canaliculatus]
MSPKWGASFIILLVACSSLVKSNDMMRGNKAEFKRQMKKMMRKCLDGRPLPPIKLMRNAFSVSESPMKEKNSSPPNNLLLAFMELLESVSPDEDVRRPMPVDSDMKNKMWNCTQLPAIIKKMSNYSEAHRCFMRAFLAPLAWKTVTTQTGDDIDSEDYNTLVDAAEPALPEMNSNAFNLPKNLPRRRMEKMMKVLQRVFGNMSDEQRALVGNWEKQQIPQIYFNCTLKPSPESRAKQIQDCGSSVEWLNYDTMSLMGPYLSSIQPRDVDAAPKENLCKFFRKAQLKSVFRKVTKMKPNLADRFLQNIKGCYSGNETLAEDVDKLGPLACYWDDVPDINPNSSRKLLSELNKCEDSNSPTVKKLKKRLINPLLSSSNTTTLLKEMGVDFQWSKSQLRILVKKLLGKNKCGEKLPEKLSDLRSVARGLPICVFKQLKAQEMLNDTAALKDISRKMRKGQLKAMLQRLSKDVDYPELVQKLPGPLLRRLPLSVIEKANISLDQLGDKIWSRSQALCLARKKYGLKRPPFRKLNSVLQGITCEIIKDLDDQGVWDMVEALSENPQWFSKVTAGCAARKLCAVLEKQRPDYFQTIRANELEEIPPVLLTSFPHFKLKELPESRCSDFLDMMKAANLSLVPLRSPSRLVLIQKALFCLGKNISDLTTEDVERLGPLLCELKPSQLQLMAPEVRNSTLQAMASCQQIRKGNRAELFQMITKIYGNPSNWSAETVEALVPLLPLDDATISALPNKAWMKHVLYDLMQRCPRLARALQRKYFAVVTSRRAARKKRTAEGGSADVPTVEMIENLGSANVNWTAAQLDLMTDETFTATVEILGDIPDFDEDQLRVLSTKAIKTFGPVVTMTETDVAQLGHITRGFPVADLEKLPFSLDTLEEISGSGWSESKMKAVWKGAAQYNNLTAESLGAAEMVSLDCFICGLDSSEIGQLNMDAFKTAMDSMDGVRCSFEKMQQLKSVTVAAAGNPNTWSDAQVSQMGCMIVGLDADELSSLAVSVFPHMSESCIPLIPPNNFAALSEAQLEALGPDNAEQVTAEQQAALSVLQQVALTRALTGSPDLRQSVSESGAPSLTVEGISAVMKPLLFLLMGFLLL